MVAIPGAAIIPIASGIGGTSGISSGNWFLKQVVTSRKLGVGAHQWATSNPCAGEGVSVGTVFIGQLWVATSG